LKLLFKNIALQKLKFILLIISILFVKESVAQFPEFNFRYYTVKDGLSNSEIYCFTQDQQGFIWLGTSNALDQHGSPKEFWDGTYQGNDATKKGMLMPQDVYVWKAEAVFADENIWKGNTYDGVKFSNTGTISLLR